MAQFALPAGTKTRVQAVGSEGRVILAPTGVSTEFTLTRPGCASVILKFEVGATVDRSGQTLIIDALAAGEPAFCVFAGGLGDALRFRASLAIEPSQ